jgi:hypothetical protein
MTINIIEYKEHDIEISVTKNQISWKLNYGGQDFGNSVILTDKKIDTLIGTIGTIITNAIESIELIDKKKTNAN